MAIVSISQDENYTALDQKKCQNNFRNKHFENRSEKLFRSTLIHFCRLQMTLKLYQYTTFEFWSFSLEVQMIENIWNVTKSEAQKPRLTVCFHKIFQVR